MNYVLITGSSGLVGSEAVEFFIKKNYKIITIDNNFRKYFFGDNADTNWQKKIQQKKFKEKIIHNSVDIRNHSKISEIFLKHKKKIKCIIHAAAQPSHDWAYKNPGLDFDINARSTLNLLECTKKFCPKATFIFVSTNKVYGDTPNKLKIKELKNRYKIIEKKYLNGINEDMSIDKSTHSLFGVSKCSADLLVQEYGRNFNLKTGVFRAGCITGPKHSGAELHGFLNYLVKCNLKKIKYNVFGYKGKQVRDNIHSYDLINAFWNFHLKPKSGNVYNIGGSFRNSCSIIEAINLIESITNKKMIYSIKKKNRVGDHICYITDVSKFKKNYPKWNIKYSLKDIINQIIEEIKLVNKIK